MKRAFISFDYDHDKGIKDLLVGQAMTDETALARAIADHLKINAGDVRLLYSERTKYVEE